MCAVALALTLTAFQGARISFDRSPTELPIDDPDEYARATYAEHYGVDPETAGVQIGLSTPTGEFQEALVAAYPDDFAGLWIDHPQYRIVVATTGIAHDDVIALASHDLRPLVETSVHEHSLQDLERIARDVHGSATAPFNLNIDVTANNIVLEALPGPAAALRRDFAQHPVVEILEVPTPRRSECECVRRHPP